MDYHEFLGQVQHRARLATLEQATRTTRAVLTTLGERLYGGESGNIAAQLPIELGRYLHEGNPPSRFDLDEFYNRVAMRENTEMPDAVYHARVVMQVLREAVTGGLFQKLRAQLPPEYGPLFEPVQPAGGERAA